MGLPEAFLVPMMKPTPGLISTTEMVRSVRLVGVMKILLASVTDWLRIRSLTRRAGRMAVPMDGVKVAVGSSSANSADEVAIWAESVAMVSLPRTADSVLRVSEVISWASIA